MSRLVLPTSEDDGKGHSHFAAGFVSMLWPGKDAGCLRFALSGTVVQPGFSGSPAFRADGSLVGVIVETITFRTDFNNINAPIHVLPIVSPIFPLLKQIEAAMAKTDKKDQP
jgi:hypothetical protein